ncbi:hypothetical protein HaLaN_08648 [Haematococcus lacustris]|uniref:Uncharacterized protein n=1 Tax=Haematococcus lacustris TaxID=44745 RepID=A0A699Z1L2_HAELA|nr:hypothetical protein HaLaN_08648 [Haematococcus lacustris]
MEASHTGMTETKWPLQIPMAQVADLQQDLARERQELQVARARLTTAYAVEVAMLADMRAVKEQLASAQAQLAMHTTTSSTATLASPLII